MLLIIVLDLAKIVVATVAPHYGVRVIENRYLQKQWYFSLESAMHRRVGRESSCICVHLCVCVHSSVTIAYTAYQLMFVCKHVAEMSVHISPVHIIMRSYLLVAIQKSLTSWRFKCKGKCNHSINSTCVQLSTICCDCVFIEMQSCVTKYTTSAVRCL